MDEDKREQEFLKELQRKGLVLRRPETPRQRGKPFKPVQVRGKPLSQVIREERR